MSSFFFAKVDNDMAHFDAHEVRHIKVLRYSKGSEIKFTDGRGSLYVGKLLSLDTAKILKKERFQPPNRISISVVLSPVRWERTRFALEKAVELGADRLYFMNMLRTTRKETESKLTKMKLIVRDAMKQCGTLYLPEVKNIQGEFPHISTNATKLMLDTKSERTFKDIEISPNIILAIGPEGGFSEKEREFFRIKKFESVKIGNRTLRTETAVIAALTLINYLLGIF